MRQHADRNRPSNHLQRRGKEDAVGGDSDAGGDRVEPQGTTLPASSTSKETPRSASPSSSPAEIAMTMSPREGYAAGAEMNTAIDEIQRAIKDRWARHEDHAWADGDQAQ